jgi:predicted HTH transcriptional regulator
VEPSEIRDLVHHGREERNLEYKGPVAWAETEVKARLTKGALALSNTRDGGFIVVGVEQVEESFIPVGLSAEQLNSFNQDDVAAHINNYADPYVELVVSREELDGRAFVIIQVREFSEIPTVCRRDGIGLRRGAIYTRTRRMNESGEIPGEAEMREILDIATEKALRRFAVLAAAGGYAVAAADAERFEAELGDL